jgi:hypothetical protein
MNATKWVAVALCMWAWGGSVAVSQQAKPAKPKSTKAAKKPPSPNEFRLTVVTRTGSGNKYAGAGAKIYVVINGDNEHRRILDNPKFDDFQVGAIDTFKNLRFDYPIDEIKSIQIKSESSDMWHCEWITFQFFKDGRQSKVYKFAPNRWLSAGIKGKAFKVVPFVEFKLTPKLEDPAEAAKPAEKEPAKVE